MGLFTRKNKLQPIEPTTIYNDETTAVPAIDLPQPEPLHQCAGCGRPGATQQLIVSYFGYITLKYVYLCEPCEEARKEARKAHYVGLHRKPIAERETVKMEALPPARKSRMRQPSKALEDYAVNLMEA